VGQDVKGQRFDSELFQRFHFGRIARRRQDSIAMLVELDG
jgi:hypothetical protein